MRNWPSVPLYLVGATAAVGCAVAALILIQEPLVAFAGDLYSPGGKSLRIQAWKARLEEETVYAARRATQDAEEASRIKTLFASAKSFRRFAVEPEPPAQPAPAKQVRQRKPKTARSYTNRKEPNSALAYGETSDHAQFETIFAPLRDSSRDGS